MAAKLERSGIVHANIPVPDNLGTFEGVSFLNRFLCGGEQK
jgi:hypothetical protein